MIYRSDTGTDMTDDRGFLVSGNDLMYKLYMTFIGFVGGGNTCNRDIVINSTCFVSHRITSSLVSVSGVTSECQCVV